ncbi:MAG: hypothetical protein FWG74_00955 [Planctomycetes bacterium]|nr:hypothetical protein [Planctomycetota bacterium]
MKEFTLLLRVFFGALFRAFFPAVFKEMKESMRDTCEDARPQPELRSRLQSRVRARWGQRVMTVGMMALALVCLAGCGVKIIFVETGDPVRLRKPVKRAAVWVMDENGKPVASRVTLPAGWYVLDDPGAGADLDEAVETANPANPSVSEPMSPEVLSVFALPAPVFPSVNP